MEYVPRGCSALVSQCVTELSTGLCRESSRFNTARTHLHMCMHLRDLQLGSNHKEFEQL